MMKNKIILLMICILLINTSICNAFHYVYLRTYNRYGTTPELDKGRSKQGDIVAILPDTHTPTTKEINSYAIFKIEGITKEIEDTYTSTWEGYAYRRYKVDLVPINGLTTGLRENIIQLQIFSQVVSEKTEEDLESYIPWQRIYAFTRPLRYIYHHYLIPSTIAETVSTINKTGEDYGSITLWEDDVDGDLVTETRQETGEVYDDDGDLNDSPIISGSTTNSSYYMKITVASTDRHDGTASSGAKLICDDDWSNGVKLYDSYTVVEWLIVYHSITNGNMAAILLNGSDQTAQNNIVMYAVSTANTADGIRIDGGGSGTTKVYNNIVYDVEGDGIRNTAWDSYTLNAYNNTIYGCGDVGMDEDGGSTFNAINNISDNNTTADYNGSFDVDTDNLDSTDAVVFENEGGNDFHLGSSDTAAKDQGTDNGTEANIDIDGRDRNSEGDTWDIGADEYVSVAGGLDIPIAIYHYMHH